MSVHIDEDLRKDVFESEDETYHLTPWGCLHCTLKDYGVDLDYISGRVGAHIVDDFMELMIKQGNIRAKKVEE